MAEFVYAGSMILILVVYYGGLYWSNSGNFRRTADGFRPLSEQEKSRRSFVFVALMGAPIWAFAFWLLRTLYSWVSYSN